MTFGRFPGLESCLCSRSLLMLQEFLLQVQSWRTFKDLGLLSPRTGSSDNLAALQPQVRDSRNPAAGPPPAALQLKPLPITWYLLAAEHVHSVHSLGIYAPWTRIMSSSIFRKLTSNCILTCSIIYCTDFSSLKLFIVSNMKNYRFAIFWCLSSLFSQQCLPSLLEGNVVLPFLFVISCRWLHI